MSDISVDTAVLFPLLDLLVGRWKKKMFPYNKKDAIIPQKLIPAELRRSKRELALFYFYLCIYMRGGIESLQAFRAYFTMKREHPELFDPAQARWFNPDYVQSILKQHIGWDSKAASINWVQNSRRLMLDWDGNPLNLLDGLRDYDEALRRIRNKRTKRDLQAAGKDGGGFRGFQPKMVSMLVYFFDWERWLHERFPYPAPADFHNFRLGLTTEAIVVPHGTRVINSSNSERLSKPWRDALMDYLAVSKTDPIDVADALWLFSLVQCGNSPVSAVKQDDGSGMFASSGLPHHYDEQVFLLPSVRPALERTCLRCPILSDCRYAIPSKPYYRKGKLDLRERPRFENTIAPIDPDLPIPGEAPEPRSLHLFEPDA